MILRNKDNILTYVDYLLCAHGYRAKQKCIQINETVNDISYDNIFLPT